jgi:thiol-disulfide isomerase/thioredoxin
MERVLTTMRTNRVRFAALLLPLALVAAACASDDGTTATVAEDERIQQGPTADTDEADGARAFTAQTLDGDEFTSASLAGTDTVLWFWAPWCTTCRAEAPDVNAAAATHDGSVQVIGVAGRGEVDEMQGFVSDTDMARLTHLVDSDGSIWSSFGVAAQPAYAFIDDTGEVEVVVGAMGEERLSARMDQLAAT